MIHRNIQSAVITGPTGVIGRALCRELAEEGIRVYAVCRPGSQRLTAIARHPNIHVVFCALEELNRLPEQIPEGADAFFHFAWKDTAGQGRDNLDSQVGNIAGTLQAVRCAAQLGCRVFLGAGSQAEYGRVEGLLQDTTPCFPENGYGMAKLCAGQMSRIECKKQKIDHIWVRIVSIYGPGDGKNTMISTVIGKLLEGRIPDLTEGRQQWDYLYSRDAARAFRLLAESGKSNAVYILGSGESRPLREYIEILRDAMDPSLPLGFGRIPYGPQQVMHLQADIQPLQEDTAFSPSVPFCQGIRETIDAYRKGQA